LADQEIEMATCLFRSPLASRLQAFLEARYGRGRGGISSQKILLYLDQFLVTELKLGQPITREVAEHWLESMAHLSPNTRINRLCILRQFCRYLSYFDSRTCLIHRNCVPRRTRPAPYIYSRHEVAGIMATARKLGPPGSLRPVVVSTLIGLLYATGLRIGEALNLTLADIDLKRRLIEVREGKFKKSRYVPISPSTAKHLRVYLEKRRQARVSTASDAPAFLNIIGARHGHPGSSHSFWKYCATLAFVDPKASQGRAFTICAIPLP
jgi:integrase